MIRSHLLAATALGSTIGFLVPGAAQAADATHDWSGFYAGVGIGLADSGAQINFSDIANSYLFTAPHSVKLPALAPTGSVRLGYNWQAGQLVYGLEADGNVMALTGVETGDYYAITNTLNSLLSLRARFGVAFDRLMLTGDAGVAAGRATFDSLVGKGDNIYVPREAAGAYGTVEGYVVGLTGEYALTDKIGLTAGAHYYALSSLHGTGVSDNAYSTTYSADVAPRGVIFEGGLNVHL